MPEMSFTSGESDGNFTHISAYEKKYFALKKRCEQLQQSNEKMVNRLHHVKKLVRKYRRDRTLLINKLDDVGDDFREVPMATLYEEGDMTGMMASGAVPDILGSAAPPYMHSPSGKPGLPAPVLIKTEMSPSANAQSSPGVSSASPFHRHSPSAPKMRKIKKEDSSPQVPKRPADAFLMFCQRQKDVVQQLHRQEHGEDMSHQDLTKQLALQWNSLPTDKKNVYFDMCEPEREQFERPTKHASVSGDKKRIPFPECSEQELDAAIDSIK